MSKKILWVSLAVFFAVAAAAPVFNKPKVLLTRPCSGPQKADIIIVLGGETGSSRCKMGLELYKHGYAPRVLLTGMDEQQPVQLYQDWRSRIFTSGGVNKSDLYFDADSRNTWHEAGDAVAIMKEHGWQSALVVSDPPQMRRLQWVWKRRIKGSGLRYFLIAARPGWWAPGKWRQNKIEYENVVLEYVKLVYYEIVHYKNSSDLIPDQN